MASFVRISFIITALVSALVSADDESATKSSDVVILTTKNFEMETQASTGATTGDWLVEFYAPWCGHCKRLQPIWEELATELKGDVNVGKVDVTGNRPLGSRFEIKGFPTIKFFHHGKVYSYQGRRTKEDFIAFVKGGYKDATGSDVPPMPTWLDEITKSITDPFKAAVKDINNGKYFTPNVFVVAMPILVLVVITFTILVLPEPVATPRKFRASDALKKDEKKD